MAGAEQHLQHMHAALALGARMLGQVAPNPAVGCVIVKDGAVVGRGATAIGGRPHAETVALQQAGALAKGATAYVSLEPCAHHGVTPPCAQALIDAGIARVVCPLEDPDPRVSGKGFAMMRAAGMEVMTGLLAKEAAFIHEGFIRKIRNGRPLFTLKMAVTLDGRIATRQGESRWISGPVSLAYAHHLRATHDGIMVGIGTALADDPQLTCRLPGLEAASPIRIVVDGKLRLSLSSNLVTTAKQIPSWIITAVGHDEEKTAPYLAAGVKLIPVPLDKEGHASMPHAAQKLAEQGLTRVMVEGGAHLAAALLRADLIDRLEWVTSPMLMGDTGMPGIMNLAIHELAQAPRFHRISSHMLGEDRLETLRRLR